MCQVEPWWGTATQGIGVRTGPVRFLSWTFPWKQVRIDSGMLEGESGERVRFGLRWRQVDHREKIGVEARAAMSAPRRGGTCGSCAGGCCDGRQLLFRT